MNRAFVKLDISLILLSASVIGYQLILMQILSIQQWHYMAFMVISIALLGFGSSGTFIAIFKTYLLFYFNRNYTRLLCFASIAMIVAPILAGSSYLQFDTYLLFMDFSHIVKLLLSSFLYFIPFLFSALAIGMSFTRYAYRIGKLYFANLIGSGVGGIVTILILWKLMPHHLPVAIAVFPFIGVLIYQPTKIKTASPPTLFILTFLFICFSCFVAPKIRPSQYKSWSKTISLPNAKLKTVQNSPFGLVQLVTAPSLRYAPSISLVNKEPIPYAGIIFVNGELSGYYPTDSTNRFFSILNNTPSALPYYLAHRQSTLILKSGIGEQIHLALINHSDKITAIELNPILQKTAKSYFNSYKKKSAINFENLSVRSFLKMDTAHYTIILFPTVGSFYGSTGLYAIEEQNWLTIEAFNIAYEHLSQDGILCISCWLDYPFRSPLKLIATLDEVLKNRNTDTTKTYLIGIKNWNQLTLMVKRSGFSDSEIEKTIFFCDSLLFDPLFIDKYMPPNNTPIHLPGDPEFNNYLKKLTSSKKREFYQTYPFYIQPATDNKPYFSQFLKFNSLNSLKNNYNINSIPYLELGYLIALITLIFLVVFGFIFIIAPIAYAKQLKIKPGIFMYFASIGVGYMLTEMLFIHQFNIYFGNPIYSVSIIISILMISSGIGSFYSAKMVSQKNLHKIPLGISILLVLYLFNLHFLINATISLTLMFKIIICCTSVGMAGFFMGIPFPSAIQNLAGKNMRSIPAAWAINGFFSVLATPMAILLSIKIGFSGLYLISGISYLLAAFAMCKMNRKN